VELNTALQAFVEEHIGAITSCRKADTGSSRITWFVESAQRTCVLREDSGDGPVANTPLTLAREATVYRTLAGSNVRIPGLIAEHDCALLVDMAPGDADLAQLDANTKVQVLNDYVDALADLHRFDATTGFDALRPPADPAAAATEGVRLWAGILNSRVSRPSPLATFASRWLTTHAPTNAERLVICHGDVGPGNFLTDGHRVTALLDWEFVHIGDPMDDLAWLAFRGHHLNDNIGDFDAQLARWQARTGFDVDRRRIAYYRVMVMYIWLVSCLAALDNGAKSQDRFTYFNLITLMNVIMPRAMMEFDAHKVPDVETDLQSIDDELSEQLSALVDLIALKWPEGDPQSFYVGAMAHQLVQLRQLQASITQKNAQAVSELVGTSIDEAENDRVLAGWISDHSERDADNIEVLYANGLRRMAANVALQGVAKKPFLSL
jgi:aminoglycoside phosphotransferase (APT) family kinase protein